MLKPTTALVVGLLIAAFAPAMAATVTEEEAHAIGAEAYLYFYPLVTMEVTREQLTNQESGPGSLGGPMNKFANIPAFPTAEMKAVVRPNFDTLYSSGWLDLTKEPVVVSAPDTGGRYYLLPMLDMWSDVFASPGWRTTGTQAENFLVTPPGWTGMTPDGFTQIKAPTPYVWIIGRTKTDGPADYDAVHKVQAGYKITPLSQWGKEPVPPVVKIDPAVDMKTSPKVTVDTMKAGPYFARAAELLKLHPPHITDQPIIARLERIGFEVGKSFDLNAADPAIQKGLESAPEDAQKLMQWKIPTMARVASGWSMNTDTMGVYGNYYLKRAIIAQDKVSELTYQRMRSIRSTSPTTPVSRSTAPATYTIHFDKGEAPPTQAFWSITFIRSMTASRSRIPLNRFAVSSWMPFKYNPDGSLDIYFQNESPGMDKEANWLPAPKGPYSLTMRIYAPKADALTGKWNPPPVMKVQTAPAGAQ